MKHVLLCIGMFCAASSAAAQAFDLACRGTKEGKLSIRVTLTSNTFVVDGSSGTTTWVDVDETKINFTIRDAANIEHTVNLNRVTGEAIVGSHHNRELIGRYNFYDCSLAKPKF